MRRTSLLVLATTTLVALAAGYWRSRDVLLTDPEIEAAIPPDLRYQTPSDQEAAALRAWVDLSRRLPSNHRTEIDFARDVDAALALGVPAFPPRRTDDRVLHGNLLLVGLSCDDRRPSGARPPLHSRAVRLARLARVCALRRGSGRTYDATAVTWAAEVLHRHLDRVRVCPTEARALLAVLPSDAELMQAQIDRYRYDLEAHVLHPLRPVQVGALLRPRAKGGAGRLDVPATLRREVEAVRGHLASMETERWDARVLAAAQERDAVTSLLATPPRGPLGPALARLRLGFHPNARGARLAAVPDRAARRDDERSERSAFAVLRARVLLLLGADLAFGMAPPSAPRGRTE